MKKVVVIGGSGFIGSHTADELSKLGYSVTIFDRRPSPWLRADQNMIEGDILDVDSLCFGLKNADIVYHFAGVSDINEASDRPLDAINLNIMGTASVLDAVSKLKVERFVYASTMYVYSSYGSFYRATKQSAETLIEAYYEKFGLEYTLLRYGSLYGPRAQDWNGLRGYVRQVVKEGRLKYDGTGRERREYVHVQDAARLSVEVLDEQYKNQAITITGTQVLNSNELIEMIFEIAGSQKIIDYVETDKRTYHYSMTPYRYTPKQSRKLVPQEFIDLGQGILEIVEEVHQQQNDQ